MLETFTLSTFAPHLGERLQVRLESEITVELELVEAEPLPPAGRPRRGAEAEEGRSFSLVFRGRHDQPLEQGMYLLEHATLGVFPLFIVPVQPDAAGRNYQAVFNRALRPAAATP